MLRDVPLAEDLTQEALLAALERWPVTGVPEKPGAWLMATARRRALDHLRRGRMLERKHDDGRLRTWRRSSRPCPIFDSALDDDIGDEMLRLIFTACHPLSVARGPRRAGAADGLRPDHRGDRAGLPASRTATIAQRIVRAKRTLVGIGAGLRNAARRGTLAAARLGARGRLSHLQRRLYRGARRGLAAPAALQRSAAPGPRAHRHRAARA